MSETDPWQRRRPMTPPDLDLRKFSYMELDIQRFRDSAAVTRLSGDQFMARLMLILASWHQVPAASLPDDDTELANLAGFGRLRQSVAIFRDLKAGALYGFLKCADGRLYHPVVAEKAIKAGLLKDKRAHRKYVSRCSHNGIPALEFDEWSRQRIYHADPKPGAAPTSRENSRPVEAAASPRELNDTAVLERFRAIYPARAGHHEWELAARYLADRIAEGVSEGELLAAAERYAAYIEATGNNGSQFVLKASSFLGPSGKWREAWEVPPKRTASADGKGSGSGREWARRKSEGA